MDAQEFIVRVPTKYVPSVLRVVSRDLLGSNNPQIAEVANRIYHGQPSTAAEKKALAEAWVHWQLRMRVIDETAQSTGNAAIAADPDIDNW